jgi:hypothetical protein
MSSLATCFPQMIDICRYYVAYKERLVAISGGNSSAPKTEL